jgi:GxxExxY protein
MFCRIKYAKSLTPFTYHGHGHLEKVYENALTHRLRKAGFEAHQHHPIRVLDEDGTIIGEYYADV